MATYSKVCGNVGTFTFGNRFTLYVVLTNRDGNPSTNKSVVDYNVYFQNTSGGGTFTSQTRLYFALNGGVIKDTTSEITGPRNGSVSIASGSTTIDHNSDGTKSISYHALVKSSNFGISGEISGTFALTTIPRASSVSGGSGNIGGTATISVSRASTSFTHTLKYAFGSLSGTIATGVGTSYTWTIPTSFYAQIPNDKSGWGTIYCETYNGSTLVGSKSTTFTATVTEASSRPTVSATLTDTNATTKALTGNASKMVKGKSTGQLVITSSVKNSATIKSVTVNGTNVGTATSITKTYANISTASFTIVTTDSRGFTNTSYVLNPSYVNYVPLTLNTTIFRPQPTGTEVQMTYSGNYFNASFGSVANTLSITWKYKVKGASSWTNGGTITPTLSGNTISSKTISLGTSYNYQTAYEFQITAVDKLTTNTQTIAVSVGMPVFHWGKNFLSVNGNLSISDTTQGGNVPIGSTVENISFDDVGAGKKLNKNFIGSLMLDNAWYNLINVRHRNGNNDGVNYGMQIRKPFNSTSPIQIRAQNSGTWGSWESLYRAKSLYDNSSGTTGTITLSESVANFSYIEIYYGNNINFMSQKIFSPNGKRVVCPYHYFVNNVVHVQHLTLSFSTTTVSRGTSYYLNYESQGVANDIAVFKIIGYR